MPRILSVLGGVHVPLAVLDADPHGEGLGLHGDPGLVQHLEGIPCAVARRLYLYTAIAPVPLSTFAGEPSQSVGKSFIKSYAAVCLEGAIIVLACIIFSLFAASPPAVDPNAAPVSMVWSYIGELVFNMLVLVGAVKMADRVVREMMGL